MASCGWEQLECAWNSVRLNKYQMWSPSLSWSKHDRSQVSPHCTDTEENDAMHANSFWSKENAHLGQVPGQRAQRLIFSRYSLTT